MVLAPIPFVPMAGLEAMDEMGRFFNKTFDLIVYPMFSIFYHTIFQRNPKPLRFSVKAQLFKLISPLKNWFHIPKNPFGEKYFKRAF